MMNKARSKRGITLIALVITVIVLLILAGISISMLTGKNSIINESRQAKDETVAAQEKEILEIAVAHVMSKSTSGSIDAGSLTTELGTYAGQNKTQVTTSGSNIKVKFIKSENEYLVDSNGNIKDANGGNSNLGLQADGSFIGEKSIGKSHTGEIDNYATANEVEGGYKFEQGNYLFVQNYSFRGYNSETGNWEDMTRDVYICWDGNYGTISEVQDLIDYANTNGVTVYWDIFDSSGAWLSNGIQAK